MSQLFFRADFFVFLGAAFLAVAFSGAAAGFFLPLKIRSQLWENFSVDPVWTV
jgi:hypothetical protein